MTSILTNRAISDRNYEHFLNVWKTSKKNYMKNLLLKVDVSLLTCVFKTFRKVSINSFELDAANYLSTPGYDWDGMLRFTDVTLKLISDIENYQFDQSTIRGGISMTFKGYAEANN